MCFWMVQRFTFNQRARSPKVISPSRRTSLSPTMRRSLRTISSRSISLNLWMLLTAAMGPYPLRFEVLPHHALAGIGDALHFGRPHLERIGAVARLELLHEPVVPRDAGEPCGDHAVVLRTALAADLVAVAVDV